MESNFGTGRLYPMKIKLLLWEASLLDKSTHVPKSKTELLPPWLHGDGCTFSSKIPTVLFRWKLIVYNSMIRSKLLYGLETLEPIKAWSLPVERFTKSIKNERRLYTLIGEKQIRKYTVEQVWPWKPGKAMTWTIRQCIDAKRIKLAGHLLRADDSDPMRQVSFQNNSASPYLPLFRRPGRPPKNWMISSL